MIGEGRERERERKRERERGREGEIVGERDWNEPPNCNSAAITNCNKKGHKD